MSPGHCRACRSPGASLGQFCPQVWLIHPKGVAQPQVSYSSRNGKTPQQAELLQAVYRIQGSSRSSRTELDKASAFLTLTVGDLLL